jgi:hypothetical protein
LITKARRRAAIPALLVAAALGSAAGWISAGWYGAAAGLLIALLVAEVLKGFFSFRALRVFFAEPSASNIPFLGTRSCPGIAALAGFAMTMDPFPKPRSSTASDSPDQGPFPVLASADRILALETLLESVFVFSPNDWRHIRRVEETAMKFAEEKAAGAYLRAFLAMDMESANQAQNSTSPSGTLAAKFALALLLLSPCRNAVGALERIEAFLNDEGCPRSDVRRAVREVFCGRASAWDILGLDPGASVDEIKKAYRSMSRTLHPDATSGMDKGERTRREEEFKRANEACELLISLIPSSLGLPPERSSRR